MSRVSVLTKSAVILATLILLIFASTTQAKSNSPTWREIKSDHFLVYHQGSIEFADKVVAKAEAYYDSLKTTLGIDGSLHKEHLNFWLWEKRCKIYVYPTVEKYLHYTAAPSWSAGRASSKQRTIWSYADAEGFLEGVLPHEIAHLIFSEYVGKDNKGVPLWLKEGVAEYAESGKRIGAIPRMRESSRVGRQIPLWSLHQIVDLKKLDEESVKTFYRESITLVHFLISEYGSSRFLILSDGLRDGLPFMRALASATYGKLDTFEKFEEAWLNFLFKDEPGAKIPKPLPEPVIEEISPPGVALSTPPTTPATTVMPAPDGSEAKVATARQRPVEKPNRVEYGEVGGSAPIFQEELLGGEKFDLAHYLGKRPIILHFSSIYCVSCVQEMPYLSEMALKYQDQLTAIGISLDSFATERVQKFVNELDFKISYPILLDKRRKIAGQYSVSVLPTTILIDQSGKIAFSLVGFKPGDEIEIEEKLEKLLPTPIPMGREFREQERFPAQLKPIASSDNGLENKPDADLTPPPAQTVGQTAPATGTKLALPRDPNQAGDSAPDFTLEEVGTGKQFSLSSYLGKVVMLEFWATWCNICKTELPSLVKEYNEWKDKGYEVLAVTLTDGGANDVKKIQQLCEKHNITYPILLDKNYEVATNLYKLSGPIPLKLIIDCAGKLRYEHVGDFADGVSEVPQVLEVLLAEPSCNR